MLLGSKPLGSFSLGSNESDGATTNPGTASFSGTGTLVATGSDGATTNPGTASFSGTGTLVATGSLVAIGGNKVYLGTTEITKIYLGSTLVDSVVIDSSGLPSAVNDSYTVTNTTQRVVSAPGPLTNDTLST